MPRFALQIDYHGGPFAGWQRQAGGQLTVQGTIEAALAKLEPGNHSVTAAGRTDAGVHAMAQVAHVDLARDWDTFRLAGALNAHLRPAPVAVIACERVADDFHARFSATGRRYLYRLVARHAPVTHDKGLVWQVTAPLHAATMQEGATRLIGKQDFTTFRSTFCQAQSPVKTLDRLTITEQHYPGGIEYRFELAARSFLHNQVRSIVGTLQRLGAGAWTADDLQQALEARNRAACGPVAPPQGLYLVGVTYPADPFAGKQATGIFKNSGPEPF